MENEINEQLTDAEYEQAYRANALFDAHRDDPEFGYRFLVDEARAAGAAMSERTTAGGQSSERNVARPRKPARRSMMTGVP